MAAQGAGALFGAGWMLRKRATGALVRVTFAAALGIAISLIAFSATGTSGLALPLIALAGLFHVICNIGMQTMAQTMSEPAMRGRVLALYNLVFRAAPALGAFLIGFAGHWFDLQVLALPPAPCCSASSRSCHRSGASTLLSTDPIIDSATTLRPQLQWHQMVQWVAASDTPEDHFRSPSRNLPIIQEAWMMRLSTDRNSGRAKSWRTKRMVGHDRRSRLPRRSRPARTSTTGYCRQHSGASDKWSMR